MVTSRSSRRLARFYIIVPLAAVVAAITAGAAPAAFYLVFEEQTVAPGATVQARIAGMGLSPSLPPMPVFLSASIDPDEPFVRADAPVLLEVPKLGRVRVLFGPSSVFAEVSPKRDLGLVLLGSIEVGKDGVGRLITTASDVPSGIYSSLLYCEQCGPSLIPGESLEILDDPGGGSLIPFGIRLGLVLALTVSVLMLGFSAWVCRRRHLPSKRDVA